MVVLALANQDARERQATDQNWARKQSQRWLRDYREERMVSEETHRELVAFFSLSEGQRMTTEAYHAWKRFRDERAYVRAREGGAKVGD